MNSATVRAFYNNLNYDDFRCAPSDVPPTAGPRECAITINGAPYTGKHTRRAIRAAMTRAGARYVEINGVGGWNAASLAYRLELE